jgi:hypothetical protein
MSAKICQNCKHFDLLNYRCKDKMAPGDPKSTCNNFIDAVTKDNSKSCDKSGCSNCGKSTCSADDSEEDFEKILKNLIDKIYLGDEDDDD